MCQFGLRLTVTSYRRRHHGDTSSASLWLAATLQCCGRIEAANRVEGQRAENGGRRLLL